jgi:hypothetical protein
MSFIYTAELPFGDHTVFRLAGLLVAERQRCGTRNGTRTLSTLEQAVMILRWFCDGTRTRQLFTDHGVARSVGYRYLYEGVAVLAWQAPDLREALMRARIAGHDHLIVDGTVIETDRLRVPARPRASTCGGPARSPIMGATSRSCPRLMTAGRCGCPTSGPAVSTTRPR